ncbi:MAG: lysine--tRNA ligase, partial [Gammaproteobacteria bacterium]
MSEDNKLIVERKKKLGELSKKAKPYPNNFNRDTYAEELTSRYGQHTKEDLEKEENIFSLAGRLLTIRKMGNSTFANLHDYSGKIQLFVSKNTIG